MASESRPPKSRPEPPWRRDASGQISSTQVMFAAILAIGLMLAINFSSRISAERSLRDVYQKVEQEIDLLRREQADLIDELNYVRSDAYVEAWAHSEGKMVRPGEVLVLPIPSSSGLEQAEAASEAVQPLIELETAPPEPENWELWWSLFFDEPPPDL